jgi:hypothetical protein
MTARGVAGRAQGVRRMGGSASKEQFLFDLVDPATGTSDRLVLRMDPLEGIVETCRAREAQLLKGYGDSAFNY